MKMKILFASILLCTATLAFGQKKDCDALLSREVKYHDRLGFWNEFTKMKGCFVDSIDINVFGKASYLNFIYNKFESSKQKVYFSDLLREIQSIRKTNDYINVRKIEVKDMEFLKKIAKAEAWEQDKMYLSRRGFKEDELKEILKIIQEESNALTYEDVILTFQEKSSY